VSFLAPVWLALAAAVVVPLMLHLMRRRVDTRFEFPAVLYLLRAEKESIRNLKLRNLLLMVLRALTIIFIALAAARPLGWLIGAGHVPTALAVVLDNSLSTGVIIDGAPLLEKLKEAARGVIDGASASDRTWLLTADGAITGGPKGVVRDAVDRTEAFGGKGDMSSVLARAAGLVLASGLASRTVVIVTDGQASAWTSTTSLGDVRVLVFAPRTTPPPNHAMAAAEPRPVRWTPRGSLQLRGTVADSATYRVSLGTRTLARGTLRGNDEVTLRAEPAERGWIAGTAELTPDELRADDTRHFAVWIGPAPSVRVDASAGQFARSAVEALAQSGRAVPGDGIEVAQAEAAAKLPALLFAPSDPIRLGAANRALERLGVPWRFGDARRDETVARGTGFDDVAITLRFPLRAEPGAQGDTLAFASGQPWIVAGERYVIVASPLDPSATSLPVRAQFLPWLADVVAQRLSADASTTIATTPGSRVRLPPGVTGLESSDGALLPATPDGLAPKRAGVYLLRRGPDRVGALVVNSEPEESLLERLDARDLASRIQSADRTVTADAALLRQGAFSGTARRPLQTAFLIVAAACLLAEMVIVRRSAPAGRRRAA
jgi:hypothetical protein